MLLADPVILALTPGDPDTGLVGSPWTLLSLRAAPIPIYLSKTDKPSVRHMSEKRCKQSDKLLKALS